LILESSRTGSTRYSLGLEYRFENELKPHVDLLILEFIVIIYILTYYKNWRKS
jgi:hypothetical protein